MIRCKYHPINSPRCRNAGTILIALHARHRAPGDVAIKVCGEHVQRYTSAGWVRVDA